jgi:hypothetical protein
MKHLERQTSFSLKDLVGLMVHNDSQYPKCLLINEIGIICVQGNDNADQDGEKCLLSLLVDKSGNNRALAFTYLSLVQEIADRNKEALASFRSNPANAHMLSDIDADLAAKTFL